MPRKLSKIAAPAAPTEDDQGSNGPRRKRRISRGFAKYLNPELQNSAVDGVAAEHPAPMEPSHTSPLTKQDTVLSLLRRVGGATPAEMMLATGWQAHSVRGFLSGTVRKKLGLNLASGVTDGQRHYRIDGGPA